MTARTVYLWGAPFLIAVLAWICVAQREKLRTLEAKLAMRETGSAKNQERKAEMLRSKPQIDESSKMALTRSSDPHLEDALGEWIENVHRLNRYLDKHPELRIPQMAKLTDTDWLSVTENGETSDAEYRYALARLRSKARQRVASDISGAIRQYAQAAGHNPNSPYDLQPYLPTDFDLSILEQLQINKSPAASKQAAGVRAVGNAEQYPFVDKSVDLWDGTLWYSADGPGIRTSEAPGQDYLTKAIDDFKKANGVMPVSATQLASYPGISKLAPDQLNAMFTAFVTDANP